MRRATRVELTGEVFDMVVIGGGITGTATARDAALRGLSVALIEKNDFASGTSSRSSKLIHGGLRYLQTYQFRLVAESLRERERALRIAPHLCEVRPFLYLLYDGYPESKWLLNLGLTFYDAASGAWRKRRHRMLSPRQVLEREPHLAAEGLRGAGLYYDVLTDDARLTMDTAKGAAEAGARMRNHTAATGLLLDGGQAQGVTVTDQLSGEVFDVHARTVLNATGPWTDRTRALEEPAPEHHIRPTKGVHIVLRRTDFPLNTAVFLRSPDDNRVVWPIPSREEDAVYIGTTDTDYEGDPDDVSPDEADLQYLINVANRTIPSTRLTTDDIVGSWAGLRPLVAPAAGVSESNTPREHAITTGPTGMLTISGGKLTTSVLMARQFVDAALSALHANARKSVAGKTPVSGGDAQGAKIARQSTVRVGVPADLADLWTRRYGANARLIADLWGTDEANRDIIGVRQLTRAELVYLVNEEMVQTVEDLLVRRTSVFFWDATGGLGTLDAVAAELARILEWPPERTAQEVASYVELVRRHRPGMAGGHETTPS